jgi:Xaa-Pro aminopeptidase
MSGAENGLFPMNYSARQKKLAEALSLARVAAIVVTHLPNVRYLCGFSGSAGVLLVPSADRPARPIFFTDGRYTQQAADEVQGARVVIGKRAAWAEASVKARQARFKVLGFEAEKLSYAEYQQLAGLLRGRTRLKPLKGTVEQMRLTKDPAEIGRVRAAVELGANLFPSALAAIRPGVPETEVAAELEFEARRAGADGMSFESIVASGYRSALPHGRASVQPIPGNGFIIIDWGVILAGYCSDATRTVHVGPVSKAHQRMYQAVREAQLASIDAVRPGVEAAKVDQAGRQVLKKAGYGAYFTHSTGHGVGIEIHEAPRLAKGQTQKLAPGMIVTVEPGIYIPGDGGVRIEDMVLVTGSGCEVLTPTPKDLITL